MFNGTKCGFITVGSSGKVPMIQNTHCRFVCCLWNSSLSCQTQFRGLHSSCGLLTKELLT